jgi:clan AA aspartic protease
MITGYVTPRHEAMVTLEVCGPGGHAQQVEALIDTGFDGFLTLPTAAIRAFALPFLDIQEAILADGSSAFCNTYQATVLWDGQPRVVEVQAVEGIPLLGMAMLAGNTLTIQVVDGGRVTIEALP